MTEPWFDPNHWAWLPGTLLGCLTGLWGSLIGVLLPLGKGRIVIFGLGLLSAGLATLSVIAGLIALTVGQPFGVWFFLIGPILPMNVLLVVALCFLPMCYRMVEARRIRSG
jgi:hypothetical protein